MQSDVHARLPCSSARDASTCQSVSQLPSFFSWSTHGSKAVYPTVIATLVTNRGGSCIHAMTALDPLTGVPPPRASRPASALRNVAQPLQAATNTLGTRKRAKDMAAIFDKRQAPHSREAPRVGAAPSLRMQQAGRRGPHPSEIHAAPPITTAQVHPVEPASRPQTRLEREKKRHYNDPPNVGPWKLGKLIGQGASGRVRLAMHSRTQQLAAVKIIPKQMLINSRMSLRDLSAKQDKLTLGIEREIVIMKLIEHPNLLGLWDVYETSKELFLVMEYVAGGELFDYLVARGRLQPHEARQYFRQIIFGVDYCHTFSICHRDLKPENLLLDGSRTVVKIADFGMAALQPTEKMLETSCGSPHYASPEIVSGMTYDGTASDIWSCGIILFALLCGRLPFDDPNIQVLLGKVRAGRFAMPSHLDPSVRDLIGRMLQVDPKKRASMREICSHPWFTDNGRLSSKNPVTTEISTLSNEPIRLAEIDPDILGNLSTLWPELTHEQIIRRLLQSGQNWQKTFYMLLVIHRDSHGTDDEDEEAEDLDEDEQLQLKQTQNDMKQPAPIVHSPSPPEPSRPTTMITSGPTMTKTQPTPSSHAAPPIMPVSMGAAPECVTPSSAIATDATLHASHVPQARESLDERAPAPVVTPVGAPAAAQLTSTPPREVGRRSNVWMPDVSMGSTAASMSVDEERATGPSTIAKGTSAARPPAPAENTASAWLMEQVRAEHARAEQLRNEHLEAERRKMEQLKAERMRAEQLRVEQARVEQIRIEKAKAEQLRAEQEKAEQARIEQARAEQLKAQQEKAEQARIEQARAEQLKAEQEKAEQARVERIRAEQRRSEQEKAEQARVEQARAEQARAEHAKDEVTSAQQARNRPTSSLDKSDMARMSSKRPSSREDGPGRRLSTLFSIPFAGRKPSLASIRHSSGHNARISSDTSRPSSALGSIPSTTMNERSSQALFSTGTLEPALRSAESTGARKPVPTVEALEKTMQTAQQMTDVSKSVEPMEISESHETSRDRDTVHCATQQSTGSQAQAPYAHTVPTINAPTQPDKTSASHSSAVPTILAHPPSSNAIARPAPAITGLSSSPMTGGWKQRLPSLSSPEPNSRSTSQGSREGDESLMRMFMREIADELDSLDAMSTSLGMPTCARTSQNSAAPGMGSSQPVAPGTSAMDVSGSSASASTSTSRPMTSLATTVTANSSAQPSDVSTRSGTDTSFGSQNRYDDANEESLLVTSVEPPRTSLGQHTRVYTPVYAAFAKYTNQIQAPEPQQQQQQQHKPDAPTLPVRPRTNETRAHAPGMPQIRQPIGGRDMPGEVRQSAVADANTPISSTLPTHPLSPPFPPHASSTIPSSFKPANIVPPPVELVDPSRAPATSASAVQRVSNSPMPMASATTRPASATGMLPSVTSPTTSYLPNMVPERDRAQTALGTVPVPAGTNGISSPTGPMASPLGGFVPGSRAGSGPVVIPTSPTSAAPATRLSSPIPARHPASPSVAPHAPGAAPSVRPVTSTPVTTIRPSGPAPPGRPASPLPTARPVSTSPAGFVPAASPSAARPSVPFSGGRTPVPVSTSPRPASPVSATVPSSPPARTRLSGPLNASAGTAPAAGPAGRSTSPTPGLRPSSPSPTPAAASRPSSALGGPPRPKSPFGLAKRPSSLASPKPTLSSGRTASGSTGQSSIRPRRSLMGTLRGEGEPMGLGVDIVGIEQQSHAHIPRPASPIGGDAPLSIGAKHSWFHGLLPKRQMHVLMSVENLTKTKVTCESLLVQMGATILASSRAQSSLPLTQQGPSQYLLERIRDPQSGKSISCKPMRFRVEYTILPVRSQASSTPSTANGGGNMQGNALPTSPGMPGFDPRSAQGRSMSPVLGGGGGSGAASTASPSFATSVTWTHEKGSLTTFRLFMDKVRGAWTLDTTSN